MEESTAIDNIDIVANFINSVLIIDDKALNGSSSTDSKAPDLGIQDVLPGDAKTDNKQGTSSDILDNTEDKIEVVEKLRKTTDDSMGVDANSKHGLNLGIISEQLASKGILSAVLPITPGDSDKDKLVSHAKRLAFKADITILDWQLFKDEETGETAKRILEEILRSSKSKEGEKKKLVVVYSAESQENITDKILTIENVKLAEQKYCLQSGAVKIVLFAKESITGGDNKVVEENELADEVLLAFAREVEGIVPQAMISALTAIRDNSDLLLSRFSSELDNPLGLHHGLTNGGGTALLTEMIAGEFDSLIDREDPGAKQLKQLDNISNSWISEITKWELNSIEDLGTNKQKKEYIKKADISAAEHNSFSYVKNIEMEGGDVPHLQLGVILKCLATEQLFLCLEQRCDCTRLKEERPFALVKLNNSDNPGKELARFAIKTDPDRKDHYEDVYIRSNVQYDLQYPIFRPNGAGVVPAIDSEFECVNGKQYQFIGIVKPLYVQSIAHNIFTGKARIGINEYEYYRM